MTRLTLRLVAFMLGLSVALPCWASSINTTQPQQGVPYNAAPIRQNFGAAASDINALASMNAGASPPSAPVSGTLWLKTPSSGTTWTLNIWNAPATAWVPIAAIDAAAGVWMPPIGGGAIPSLVSASTTDLGSVPQAVINITGSQTIASFGASTPPGQAKFLVFGASPTLVQNATFMRLPGGNNLTPQPNDTAIAISLGGGQWRVVFASGGGAGATSVTNLDGTLTISPTTGAVIASLNVGHRNSWTAPQRGAQGSVTISTSTFTPDMNVSQHFSITLIHASCPCTIANPANISAAPGQVGMFKIVQSSTGNDTITSWGSDWKFSGGTPPTLSTGANAIDYFAYYVDDATHVLLSPGIPNAQ